MRDLHVLDFLWTWKVAATPMLKEVAYKDESHWWVYKALRRLKQEKYIQHLPRGKNLDLELWALTKLGFEVVLMDRDDLEQYRHRVHAPTHDYLATCLQLGDLWQTNVDARFLTEQMLSSLASWNFPPQLKKVEGHIPDGVTIINGNVRQAIIGYEVDINLKEEERYLAATTYYQDGLKPHLVVWLVRNQWISEKIFSAIERRSYGLKREEIAKFHVFCLLDEFKNLAWGAPVLSGPLKGQSIRKLHANHIQSVGKANAKLGQRSMTEIFFPKFKSPQKSMASLNPYDSQPQLTPFGSRGVSQSILVDPTSPSTSHESSDSNNPSKEGMNEPELMIGALFTIVILFSVLIKAIEAFFTQAAATFTAFGVMAASFVGMLIGIAKFTFWIAAIGASVAAAIYFSYRYFRMVRRATDLIQEFEARSNDFIRALGETTLPLNRELGAKQMP